MPLPNFLRTLAWWKKAAAPAPAPAPSGPPQIFGKTLVDLNAGHMSCLMRIKSPFLDSIRLARVLVTTQNEEEKKDILQAAASIQVEIRDIALIVLIFSRPAAESRRILCGPDGRAALDSEADALMNLMPPLPDWESVQSAIASHYTACLYAKLNYLKV